jgi:hypothetical protein
MTGSAHNPVIQRNSLLVLKVLYSVIYEPDVDRKYSTHTVSRTPLEACQISLLLFEENQG